MDDYLSKPIQSAELKRILDKFTLSEPIALPQPEPMDKEAALACMSGDAGILADIAALFLDDFPKLLGEIRTAVASGHAVALHRAAHTLKGSLGYLGARPAETQARKLEGLGRSGELEGAVEVLAELENQLARLRPAVVELASASVAS
jgi:HPt (histidine-containing phosphotransfer) domain-containing protein